MPRVNHVKKAARDHPEAGILKGESYYWWKFRHGGKHKSKVYPRPSQLTQSDFLSTQLSIEERINDLQPETREDLKSEVEDIIAEIRQLGEEQSDKQGNMPDSLQYSPTGELLEGRYNSCEEWADELEAVDLDTDDELGLDSICDADLDEGQTKEEKLEELKEGYLQELLVEVQGCQYGGE
jgi:hypothetical protein